MPYYGDPFNKSITSFKSQLNNKAGKLISGISNPALRDAAGGLLNAFLPGAGGGIPELGDNKFTGVINNRLNKAYSEELDFFNQEYSEYSSSELATSYDWRARLRPKDGGADKFYNNEVLGVVKSTNGLVWLNTPSIYFSASANYNSRDFQGSNYPIYTYNNSNPGTITVTADWHVNDQFTGMYFLAMQYFMKVATKSYFGEQAGGDAGIPPPVLLFEYLGDHGFNEVPVVVSNYTLEYSKDVDYVPVVHGDTVTYVPTMANLSVTLSPMYTPHKLRKEFNIENIANGDNYKKGFI